MTGPEPPLDPAERWAARRTAWRERRPLAARRIALARRAALWLAIPWLVVVCIVLPGAFASIGVTLGLLWLMLQVSLLARSKSLSWAAYARTFSLSALAAWPIGLVEIGIAAAFGLDPAGQAAPVAIAAPVEETLKLLPLAAVMWFATNRWHRMGVADHLLLGLAAGAGFQLTEEVIRRVVAASHPDPGIFGRLIQELVGPVGETDYGPFALFPGGAELGGAAFAGHGVLTALVAGGIGLAVRLRPRYGARIVLIPAALWLLAVIDHALFNFAAVTPIGNEPTVTVPGRLLDLHGAWGGGKEAVPLLLALIAAALVVDYRAVGSARPSLPPLPVPPERGRAREVLEETATLIGAAARGPHVWRAAIPWLRARRELAYGIDHGEPRRRAPDADALATAGLALRAALAAAVTALALTAGVAGLAAAGAEPAFLAGLLDDLGSWWDGLSFLEQTAAVLGLAALLGLAGMGFLPALGLVSSASAIAEHGQGLAELIRDPRKAARDFIRDMTPGEALAYVLGLVLERVLRGLGKRFADRFGPRKAADDVADEAEHAAPPPRVRGTVEQDAKAFRDGAVRGTEKLEQRVAREYGVPKPAGTATHHIVPKGVYASRADAALLHRSQALLHRFGIGPDDAPNGAFVPEATHRPLHTNAYFRALNARLRTARSHGEAVAILRDIADEIVNGTFP
jgi:RsiW-degrading membrane proteinase PrsW (M82 family)